MGNTRSVRGHIIVIVAPSGTGKSTLIKKLKSDFPHLKESISYTTRGIRPGEENGKDYFFIEKSQFQSMIDNNELLEWAVVHSNYYGTGKGYVQGQLEKGSLMLFDLDVQGADNMKAYYPNDSSVIFIAPPNIETLEERLRGRGTETETIINERLTNAKNEIKRQHDFDYRVLNDSLESAHQRLKEIFKKIIQDKGV